MDNMDYENVNNLDHLDHLDHLENSDGKNKKPIVTLVFVISNVCIWAVLEFFGDTLDAAYILKFGGIYPDLVIEGEWYRLITAVFLHFGAEHLANNMIFLAAAGCKLEQAVGSIKYLLIYLGAGIAGNLLSLLVMVHTEEYAVCAGASGAVFGIIGALLWAVIRNHGKLAGLTAKGLLLMLALSLYNGIATVGVDNWAHLGGAVGGFFLCIPLYRKP